jgi:hypothetical protein
MKKLVFALSMFIGAVAVNAQDTTTTASPTDPTSTESSTTQPSTTTESSTSSTTTQPATDATSIAQEDGRVQMKSQDLPEGIKEALEGQGYTGWLISSAYKVDAASTGATGNTDGSTDATNSDTTSVSSGVGTSAGAAGAHAEEMYIVVLKNGAQTKTVRFDKEGKELDDAGLNDQK